MHVSKRLSETEETDQTKKSLYVHKKTDLLHMQVKFNVGEEAEVLKSYEP